MPQDQVLGGSLDTATIGVTPRAGPASRTIRPDLISGAEFSNEIVGLGTADPNSVRQNTQHLRQSGARESRQNSLSYDDEQEFAATKSRKIP